MQTGQLNPMFYTFADLVNRVVEGQTTDWSVPNSQFSPNDDLIRVFHEHTELTKMTILASQALLYENKKKSATKCYLTEH